MAVPLPEARGTPTHRIPYLNFSLGIPWQTLFQQALHDKDE